MTTGDTFTTTPDEATFWREICLELLSVCGEISHEAVVDKSELLNNIKDKPRIVQRLCMAAAKDLGAYMLKDGAIVALAYDAPYEKQQKYTLSLCLARDPLRFSELAAAVEKKLEEEAENGAQEQEQGQGRRA